MLVTRKTDRLLEMVLLKDGEHVRTLFLAMWLSADLRILLAL